MTALPVNFTRNTTTTPFSILYVATSPAGNLSSNATRLVYVVDPCATTANPTAFTCNDTLQCSVNGL